MPNVLTALTMLPAMAPNPVDEGPLRPGLDPSQVTPGMAGFLISLLLAVAVILLILDFNRRSRRLRYRAEYAERRAAEERVGGYAGGPESDAPVEGAGSDRRTGPAERPGSAGEAPVPPAAEPEGPGGQGRRG